jgi:hypothetical protein
MIGSFLAFPLVWLLGGRLELTERGIYSFAAWLLLSAFLNVLVLAPFANWRERRSAAPSTRPKLGSLVFHSAVPGILIEPTGANRFDFSMNLANQNDDLLKCEIETQTIINGVVVESTKSTEPHFVSASPGQLTVTISVPNVKIDHVNAMVGVLNISVRYKIEYVLAEFPSAEPRTTGRLLSFRAPIHMTGKPATNQVHLNFSEQVET